jgi:DNA-binding PucR family transcriptional regulator
VLCLPAPPDGWKKRFEEVAAALFVHPQTVRYRMGQLRDLFPDLTSAHRVLELTLAVGLRP